LKKIGLGQSISIVANVGVIASIIFLGLELRDNTIQARIATTRDSATSRTDLWELIAADDALASIYMRGLVDFDQLSPTEQTQFDLVMRSLLTKIYISMLAREAGLINLNPELEQRVLEGNIFRMLDHPGFREWWETADRRGLSPDLTGILDELNAYRVESG